MMAENEGQQRMTCEPCRHRKVKCNRAFPTCARCLHLGATCVYPDRVSRRSTQSAVIQLLRERVRQAEARLVLQTSSNSNANSNAGDDAAAHSFQHGQHGRAQSSSCSSLAFTPPSAPMPSPTPVDQVPPSLPTNYSIYDNHHDDTEMNNNSNSSLEFPKFDEGALGQVDFNLEPFHVADMEELPNLQTHGMDTDGDFPSFPDWVQTQTPPLTSNEATPSETGQMGQLTVPPDTLNTLHQIFFADFALVMPIIAKSRFNEELLNRPNDIALKAVSFAMALLGASISETHRHLEKTCYAQARLFADMCETGDESGSFQTIRFLQALLFLARYELNKGYCARAWLTFGRATGVSKIMRLSQMDQMGTPTKANEPQLPCLGLPSTTDILELEERRRSFWALYILQGFCCVTTDRAGPLEDTQLFVFLPSAGDMDASLDPSQMPYVTEVTAIGNSQHISSFCGAVIVLSVLRRVLQHASGVPDPTVLPRGFWDRHYKLVSMMDTCERLLRPLFSMRAVYTDTLAFNAYLTFCGAAIRLYEAAIDQGEQQGLSRLIIAESAKQSAASAFKVASVIRSTWGSQRSFCNTLSLSSAFVSWPLTMAIRAFSRQAYSEQQDLHGSMIRMLHGTLEEADGPNGPWQKLVNELPAPST
ncbi:hypothetical protein PG990_014304 [Apiospora arundinis]